MKKIILALAVLAGASSAFAAPAPLVCKTTGAGGAMFKQIVVETGANGTVIRAEDYTGGGLSEVKIVKKVSTPASLKLQLEVNLDMKVSLVIFKRQAVVLYETLDAASLTEDGASVEFLSCK